ncbi:cyclase family protein [Flavobacterium sp. J372]|uniref:cyclase family protein n=1 Tax=Flavobacterium sp. J372 TaxID=2898436 RepID=UPI0021511151|nr:cyclase family protein [Flavobacterium sp. J372]MCR5861481.1 cyclase family protein [Flavobacterium sp. J372]
MKATIIIDNREISVDLSKPIDISLPITADGKNPVAWYLKQPIIEPVQMGGWTGKVSEGASTNFNNIAFNPHGHGTHTECLGHITKDFYSINDCLKRFLFMAELVSVHPEVIGDDFIITRRQVQEALANKKPQAVIFRTLPNIDDKKSKNYSYTNPPYLAEDAAVFLRESVIKHLLIDLPSVDREEDDGALAAHKAFWNVKDVNNLNDDARLDTTITELIFVPDDVEDGSYLLNLQIVSFDNDASPSKPVLYKIFP